jgi:hypothetical protein
MSRQTTILLVGAAIGAGLLEMSSASAAPVSATAIRDAASVGDLTQKVIWRGRAWGWGGGLGWRAGWRGTGWRGNGWRAGWGGWGWRPGLLGVGLATAAAYNYGYGGYSYDDDGYSYGWRGYGWRPGWRVGWGGWGPGWGGPGWGGWGPGWGGWRVGWRPGWRFAAAW